jgi:TolB-like protein/Flp pilus assembly protein TadD
MSFFQQLKRRNVFKVAAAYLLVAWLLMQISDVMVPTLHLPEWVMTATAYFLIIGFLPAIIFAWAFEMTPEGLRRESEVTRVEPTAHQGGQKLNYVIIGALAIVIVLLLADRFMGNKPDVQSTPTATAAVGAEDESKTIAVLPFTNLSTEEENAFFAAGVHEDILTALSRVSDLRVNSRTSVMQYAGTQMNMKDVAEALGARYILEGSVRRSGNRVRVTAQLIDAKNDVHLWAESFDRELTDIFAIQSAVAQEITNALQAELSPVEKKLITGRPTENIEAYDLFLKARLAMQNTEIQTTFDEVAIRLLEQATQADPNYAQAWALLAVAHGGIYWFRVDPDPSRLERMKQAVDRAFELQPDLPEARLALATYYYRGFYDYAKALEQLNQALLVIPNDPLVHFNLGLTYRRLGQYDQSIVSFLRATEIDPMHQSAWAEASSTANSSNRYREAISIEKEIAVRFPRNPRMVAEQAFTRLNLFGDIKGAKEILGTLRQADHYYLWLARFQATFWDRDYQAAAAASLADNGPEATSPGTGIADAARTLSFGGFKEQSSELREKARQVLSAEINKPYAQNYAWPHAFYAVILIMEGETEGALQSCERALGIMNLEMDKLHGATMTNYCAWVNGMAGRTDQALDQLEALLELGWNMSYWVLSLSPEWDLLRENPRFQQLVAKAKLKMEAQMQDAGLTP